MSAGLVTNTTKAATGGFAHAGAVAERAEKTPAAAPLTAVLEQVRAGAPSLAAIAQRTGLPLELVRMGVERLVELGELSAEPLDASCPAGGCGTCPRIAPGTTCASNARRGAPVLLRLALTPGAQS